jgi:uncharacterized protein (DUF1330 family)
MTKGYWIITFRSVNDPTRLAAYVELAAPVLAAAGAKFIVRGMPVKVYEAGVQERTVAIEFETVAKAVGVYGERRIPTSHRSARARGGAGRAYPCRLRVADSS